MAKARIQKNRYDNWYGYLGNRKVIAFGDDSQGTQEQHAQEWLKQQNGETLRSRGGQYESPAPVADPEAEAARAVAEAQPEASLADVLEQSVKLEKAKKSGCPHLIIEARAGTGKTTTLVCGLQKVRGDQPYIEVLIDPLNPSRGKKRVPVTPSPQQAAVWESMELSRDKARSIGFCAFNKSIATELQGRVPAGCDAMTLHSLGNKAVYKAFGRLQIPKDPEWVVRERIAAVMGKDLNELRKHRWDFIEAVRKLVGLCKMNLVCGSPEVAAQYGTEAALGTITDDDLDQLAGHYEVELNGGREEAYDLVPKVLEYCLNPTVDGRMDFDDMIWLPVVLDLPVNRYDVLLVDEAQDLNRCQQALTLKAGDRLILCGDPKQAIYGFAGADSRSMDRMAETLGETDRGCVTLPLTVTRRCGKAIVREAQAIVPDFDAFETNPEGVISRASFDPDTETFYGKTAKAGDRVLCRVNAPLVSQCFRFLKEHRKATILGRDIGQGLISTVKKLTKDVDQDSTAGVVDLISALSEWLHEETQKEMAKRNPSDSRLIALQDRYECLVCFTEGAGSINGVIRKIESIFTDNRNDPGIQLSSIHKAKGLEAHRVFLLEPEGATVPHPMAKSAWQKDQEMNLRYVAITRAITELVYVS